MSEAYDELQALKKLQAHALCDLSDAAEAFLDQITATAFARLSGKLDADKLETIRQHLVDWTTDIQTYAKDPIEDALQPWVKEQEDILFEEEDE